MNAGLIAARYASALLLFAKEEQAEDRVYEDSRIFLDALQAAEGPCPAEDMTGCIEGLSEPMQKFITLVLRNKRAEYLPAILNAYRDRYRKEKGITRAWLTTAADNPDLADKLGRLMKEHGFSKVDFKTETDPALIGGFVMQIEDKRLDASVASQLKNIRKELEAKLRKKRQHG